MQNLSNRSRHAGRPDCTLTHIMTPEGAPVFTETTTVSPEGSTVTFHCDTVQSVSNTLRVFIQNGRVDARQLENDSCGAYLHNPSGKRQRLKINILADGQRLTRTVKLGKHACAVVKAEKGKIRFKPLKKGRE